MAHRVTAAIAAAVALALAAGCTSSPKPAPDGTPTATRSFQAGAPGIGDTYYPEYGNGGYDVGNYALNLRYDPATDQLSGTATITASATQDLSQFNLDFAGLTIERVTVDGAEAKTSRDGAELVVTPTAGLANGSQFIVEIRYAGVPEGYPQQALGEIGFLHTSDGAVALGQPEVAATWFPVNDHPRDKATYTIAIAAPDGLSAMSNGVLKEKKSADGWTTWTWAESRPMASYLATVVIGNYRIKESTHDGKPVFLAVDRDLPTQVDAQIARTPEVVDFLESKFGPYPFDAIGGIVVDESRIRFALETQSRPVYSRSFFDFGDGTWVIAHEIGHQWYGDSVSVNEWKEIWLNEGFATYAEWLWVEAKGGQSVPSRFEEEYSRGSEAWTVPPGDPGAPLFDSPLESFAIYERGGMTLHALRVTVGDDAFFKILQTWAVEKRDANATTPEFIAVAERISGKQLDDLFRAWLFGKVRPPRPTG